MTSEETTETPESNKESSNATGDGWGSRIGVILAVAGSAVGLGNFLRFPGQAAQNGGGAFMIPYFISLLMIGIPLCWAEWTMGRYGGSKGFNSAPGIYSVLWRNSLAKYLGVIALMIPLIIYMYYVLLESWCLVYALGYLLADEKLIAEGASYGDYFGMVTGMGEDGALLDPSASGRLGLLALVFGINFVLIYRGINKGIETFCRIAMPIMVMLAIVVLIRVLTLSPVDDRSVGAGLGFMWNPDYKALTNPQTWLAASGQIFFSLSVGFGIIINYASYLKRDDDVVLSGLTSSSLNEFFEVCLGGLITLPAAFLFLGIAAGDQGTFGLGFVALPNVFAEMPGGQFFGFLWFFMLFIAAITSSVSMLQPVIAFLEEGFGLKRHASATLLGLLTAIGSMFVMYFSKDLIALDTFDFWVGSVMLFLLALAQSLIYGWAFGIKKAEEEAHVGAYMRIPRFVQYMLKYIVPAYLIVIFGAFVWNNALSHDEIKASIDGNWETVLESGIPTKDLMLALGKEQIAVTKDMVFTEFNSDNLWLAQIPSEESDELVTLFQLKQASGELSVIEHQAGYIENISNSRSATFSIYFIAAIALFLTLLVHIAGKRWKKEGRI